jgi:hypothetical protein
MLLEEFCVQLALSTTSGRRLFNRLNDSAGEDTNEDPKDNLTLHGSCRDAGDIYSHQVGHSVAQRAFCNTMLTVATGSLTAVRFNQTASPSATEYGHS